MSQIRSTIAGRSIRWNPELAAQAYGLGLWVHETLAQRLATLAQTHPGQILLVDGDYRLDAKTLHDKASALASVLAARFDVGSVVSFMLPNWHEAAIIYLAASRYGGPPGVALPSGA